MALDSFNIHKYLLLCTLQDLLIAKCVLLKVAEDEGEPFYIIIVLYVRFNIYDARQFKHTFRATVFRIQKPKNASIFMDTHTQILSADIDTIDDDRH